LDNKYHFDDMPGANNKMAGQQDPQPALSKSDMLDVDVALVVHR
jgi:hypothetical protein